MTNANRLKPPECYALATPNRLLTPYCFMLLAEAAEYIQALVDSREQNATEPFREFMLKEHIKNLQHEIATYNESANEVKAEGGQKTEKVDRKGGQKTREAIMKMIAKDSKITSTQMAEILGINRSAVSKHLKKMQEDGIIKREGPDKGGKWVVL